MSYQKFDEIVFIPKCQLFIPEIFCKIKFVHVFKVVYKFIVYKMDKYLNYFVGWGIRGLLIIWGF